MSVHTDPNVSLESDLEDSTDGETDSPIGSSQVSPLLLLEQICPPVSDAVQIDLTAPSSNTLT